MPSRNRIKLFVPQSFYHIYNRGVEKRHIYLDTDDYAFFVRLFKRYLSDKPQKDSEGTYFASFRGRAELVAFCLMPNHFHALFFQDDRTAITELLQRICTAYTGYFNRKYNRVGPLFQDRFRAALIDSNEYLTHVSRYIHLNPSNFEHYTWSSLPYFLGDKTASWINPERVLNQFQGDYLQFVADYKDQHDMLEELKHSIVSE